MCVLWLLLHRIGIYTNKRKERKRKERNDDKINNSFYVLAAQHMLRYYTHYSLTYIYFTVE